MSEQSLVRAIMTYLRAQHVLCWRQNQGAVKRSYRGRERFVRFAEIKGISDILGVLPPDGRFIAIECKSERGRVTPEQDAFLQHVKDAGGVSIVARSLEDVQQQLAQAGWLPTVQL